MASGFSGRRRHNDKGDERRRGMGYKRLQELLEKDDRELLNVVSNKQSGFYETLCGTNLKPDWVTLIVRIGAKVCREFEQPVAGTTSNQRSNSAQMMTFFNLLQTSQFFALHLSRYISSILTEPPGPRRRNFPLVAKEILIICKTELQVMPGSINSIMPVLLTLEMVLNMIRNEMEIDESIQNLLDVTKALADASIKKPTEEARDTQNERGTERRREREPLDDYRQLSIFPTAEDLSGREDFLRRNKTQGAYENVHQYLDIHFRLLRADFMQPLREGISEFLNNANQPGERKPRQNNIRIYQNVRILHPVCTDEGAAYRIQFDVKRLSRVRWDATRRLIYGALVCLSPDSFNTVYFATVSQRDAEELKHGIVELRFHLGTQEVREIGFDQKLIMAESSAYFEAYRHVLHGLQQMSEETFPFPRHLIKCESKVLPPSYLRETDTAPLYDFRPLQFNTLQSELYDDDMPIDLDTTSLVPVLNRNRWPSHEEMALDESQAEALKLALTKELAIIQGPPGTGKTHVGLKVVQMLIHNAHFWKESEECPMLIICYTNHALDQFLEGICKFHQQGIVRVGGRSKSKQLERFYLRELRRDLRSNRDIPVHIHRARMDAMDTIGGLRASIQEHVANLLAEKEGIVSEESLEEFMEEEHFDSLCNNQPRSRGRNVNALITWLGLVDGSALQLLDTLKRGANRGMSESADQHEGERPEAQENEDETEVADHEVAGNHRMLEGDMELQSQDDGKKQKLMEAALKRLALRFTDLEIRKLLGKGGKPSSGQRTLEVEKMRELLNSVEPMYEAAAQRVRNLFRMQLLDRWRIYKLWLQRRRHSIQQELRDLENQYELATQQLNEIKQQEDLTIMRKATVLAMTTTGAARYREILQDIKPRIVVVEEAAEVLEAHILTALTSECAHLILIGDHKQLRPNPTVYKLAETYKLKVSLFERLVINDVEYKTLAVQHRMRPDISKLLLHIYPKLSDHNSVENYPNIPGVSSNLCFINHGIEETPDSEQQSKVNDHEAQFVVALCKYLTLQGYNEDQVTVLTPYMAQVRLIRRLLRNKHIDQVRCCAVDNFQGEENDIILLSLVRSNEEGAVGFLKANNRICVSMSRAKHALYIIGNAELLSSASELWSKILSSLQKAGCLGPSLPLYCQNHRRNVIEASAAEDFDLAPEGGCLEPCGKRLQCGHACVRVCHVYDKDHESYKCRKPCGKTCANNHRCKKLCFQECGPCSVVTRRRLPGCGHVQDVPCHEPEYIFECKARCEQKLHCGHSCANLCGKPHTQQCQKVVTKSLPCSHDVKVKCHEATEHAFCPKKCSTVLKCEHICGGSCGTCLAGRIHAPCTSKCSRILVCGHECTDTCTTQCPPCEAPCENRCAHSVCQEKCGTPCVPCIEPCAWRCKHFQCNKLCHEPCDRPRCNAPCPRVLDKCGHKCIGLCGEPCPDKCRICDKDEVEEIFFGDEDEPKTRFVQLEDCGHVLASSGLDQWMKQDVGTDTAIGLKGCPKCKTPIRRNLRYGGLVKKVLNDVENVKKMIMQGSKSSHELKSSLQKEVDEIYLSGDIEMERIVEKKLEKENDIFTREEAVCIENIIRLANSIAKNKRDLDKFQKGLTDAVLINSSRRLATDREKFRKWLVKDHRRFAEQETSDAMKEIERLQLWTKALNFKHRLHTMNKELAMLLNADFERSWRRLTSGKPLEDADRERAILDEVSKHLTGLEISIEEKNMILNAMAYEHKGHWYKCPNGHVYTIGQCGGATVESQCPECKAQIGGTGHRLRSDNRIATEMDGATMGAYDRAARLNLEMF